MVTHASLRPFARAIAVTRLRPPDVIASAVGRVDVHPRHEAPAKDASGFDERVRVLVALDVGPGFGEVTDVDVVRRWTAGEFVQGVGDLCRAVSYTHLRAHETDSYLVC